MSFYITAIEGLPKMLLEVENPIGNFKRKTFAGAFERYYEQHLSTMEALDKGYGEVIDKEQYLKNMAEAMAEAAEKELAPIKKSNQKENRLMDFNFCLAVYVFPSLFQHGGEGTKALAEVLAKTWKEHFPRTNVTPATYEQINAGFKRKFCYITTAVCMTMGKPDDCYELNCFRSYRDQYLLKREDGEAIVSEYYDIAPTIIKRIEKQKDYKKIYQGIWDTYLKPCLSMIENNQNEECRELYTKMVRELAEEYFYTN